MNRRRFTQSAIIGIPLLTAGPGRIAQATVALPSTRQADVALFTHEDGPHLSGYIDALARTPEVRSVYLCDPQGATMGAVRTGVGAKLLGAYKSPGELFRECHPLVALVAMEAVLAPLAIQAALDAGCHVLAEKPACVRPADFAPLVATAKARDRHLMLALTSRLERLTLEARRIIRAGAIGKIFGVEIHSVADQTRVKSGKFQRGWMAQKARAGGGHLTWLGIHWLDLAMYVTGSPITHVAGFSGNVGGQPIDTEDSAAVALRFANGSFGTMTSGYYLDRGKHLFVKIWGSEGWLQINQEKKLPLEWYSTQSGKPESHGFTPPVADSGLAQMLGHTLRAAMGLEAPAVTPDECLYVLQTISAAYKAADTGYTQPVVQV